VCNEFAITGSKIIANIIKGYVEIRGARCGLVG
jgi:hypothetical protein